MAFNKTALLAIAPPATGEPRIVVKDDRVTGLRLTITPNGTRTFSLVKKINGRMVRITLGTLPPLTVENARQLANQHLGDIARGIDPREKKKAARADQFTLRHLFDEFLERHAKLRKRSWKEDEAAFTRYLSPWAKRRASSITNEDVERLHAKIGKDNGVYAANRLLALLSAMYSKGITWKRVKMNPAAGIPRFPEKSRERFLHPDEVPRLFEAIEAEPDATIRDYFLFLLFTGCRRSNGLEARWEDIHLDRAIWTIPRTKSGESQVVALAKPVVELLRARQQMTGDSPWVFPSYGKSGHLSEPKMAWDRIRERSGLTDLRLHDLRRSFGSWQARNGSSLIVISKTLGHLNSKTTEVYSRLDTEPVRTSVETAVQAMLQAAKKPE